MAISKIGSKALVDCSVAAVDIEDGSITSAKLAGSIANAKLANSSITVNGTSINLGASGSIPAVSWQSVVTADGSTTTSAVAGNGYFIDTTSNAHTINLPGSPSAGDTIAIKDYAGTFATNNLTIGRNGNNIQGIANDSQISTNRASLTLVYVDATKGWLYAVESNVADLQSYIVATGGTVTTSGDFKIHTFTGDGCFVVSNVGDSSTVDYLVVAGGGGSGSRHGGGGGGGGYRESSGTASGCYTVSPLGACVSALPVSATTYPVTVGGGGVAGRSAPTPRVSGTQGSPSVFSTITSTGGGGGVTAGQGPGQALQLDGGSGGGGALCGMVNFPSKSPSEVGGLGNTPPVSPPQGNPGGAGQVASPYNAGGGGGATATGVNGAPTTGGNGGAGGTTHITGSPVAYAGGGGGGGYIDCGGAGGTGGGGDGGDNNTQGTAGTANTGGGAGGTGNMAVGSPTGPQVGANGGKGIVIIRYKYQ